MVFTKQSDKELAKYLGYTIVVWNRIKFLHLK